MIRMATVSDLDSLLILAGLFHAESHVGLEFDDRHTEASFKRFIETPEFCLMIVEEQEQIVGMLAGVAFPNYFSAKMQAQEMFWFIDEDYRCAGFGKALLGEFEKWAVSKGATELAMVALTSLNLNEVTKLYESLGYREIERSFVRVL